MRIRTYSNIAVPMALLALACAASRPTAVFAGAWLAAGVMAIGYRSLDSFPSLGLGPAWRQGPLSTFVWAHHLVCWPRYVGLLPDWLDRQLNRQKRGHR
ncbi:hypothetical protein [Paraburkholderia phosphatilytica]|uniref:hypothetical protein n=1 Tax=Paraburkholderia phosphatilytica TaxID=2282883 RepID=UPI000F5DBB5D|nr:hypothetical protein [Paraburkholderia phosphatilytica]